MASTVVSKCNEHKTALMIWLLLLKMNSRNKTKKFVICDKFIQLT
jgi:hypothetical protein